MLGKSSVYVLGKGMYFLDKSPSNFNLLIGLSMACLKLFKFLM